MAFDGSGTYVRNYNWTQDAANAVPITASRFDTEHNGFAAALSICITRDGQGKPTSNIDWNAKKITNLANPTGLQDAVTLTSITNPTALTVGPDKIQTAAENSAVVTPVNYYELPGYIERYGTNTTPGTTDMTAALVAANAQALQAGGSPITAHSICHIASATTITGKFQAHPIQVFSATSLVTFGRRAVRSVYPEWWGAKDDGTYNNFSSGTDNLAAFNKAIASLPTVINGGGEVRLGGRDTYLFSGALTLRSDLAIVGVENGMPFSRTPILQAAGTGIFLDVNYQRVSLVGFQVFGNNVASASGIRIADQHNNLDNIVVSQFDGGAASYGLALSPAATKQALYTAARNVWVNSCYNGVVVGDGAGGVCNANTFNGKLITTGNSRNGLLIQGTNVLSIFGIIAEGNVTGGTGANINVTAGTSVEIHGYTEIVTETGTKKNIILPAGATTSDNFKFFGYADGSIGTNLTSEDVYSYYVESPRHVANNEPPFHTNISANSYSAYDPNSNNVTAVLQTKNGPVFLGAVKAVAASSWASLSMRNNFSVANNATFSLTALLQGARTAIEGMLIIHSDQDNCAAIFYLKNSTTVEYLDPANKFSVTVTTANMTNVYYTGGVYTVENKTGGTRNYSLHLLMT